MSFCTSAIVPARSAVAVPTAATMPSVSGAWPNSTAFLPIMYTPAVTIVAAWMSADTGVGPSMASGSQTNSGICADFPVAPMKSISVMIDSVQCLLGTQLRHRAGDLLEVQCAEAREDQQDAEDESPVADAIDDECFLAGVGCGL